ncbi:MAG TPA: Gfo/Idh/MocA family oxidoreductase [Gemmataceae bacterium]|jgi:predicted dehydrogenase|nr:Gfo/Idh/MocA family oxidoreductase [Gemmataceae bacterium]
MKDESVLRVAMIGCGVRGAQTYLPVLLLMKRHFHVIAVCDVDSRRASAAGELAGAAVFTDLDDLLEQARPDLAVVVVSPPPSDQNGVVALRCLNAGVAIIAETPIARTLEQANRLLVAAEATSVPAEIAENYCRTPFERFKRLLLDGGVFGPVHVVYSDFVGHGYHGISLLRAHIGQKVAVTRVLGLSQHFGVERHQYRPGEWRDEETWQMGVLEFANGSRGILSFSTLAYGSPLRWGRARCAVRFHAARGMGIGPDLAILAGSEQIRPIRTTIRTSTVSGIATLDAIVSDLPDGTGLTWAWENPLRDYPLTFSDQYDQVTIGLELLSIYRALTGAALPEYPLPEAFADRQIDLALEASRRRSEPITIATFRENSDCHFIP